jgi:hypothetical protein
MSRKLKIRLKYARNVFFHVLISLLPVCGRVAHNFIPHGNDTKTSSIEILQRKGERQKKKKKNKSLFWFFRAKVIQCRGEVVKRNALDESKVKVFSFLSL